MATAIRRVGAAANAPSRARVNGENASEEKEVIDLEPIGRQQQADLQNDWVTIAQRYARGAHLWAEKGWQWVTPDWHADPEVWPPLAKLTWLYVQQMVITTHLQLIKVHLDMPVWCIWCHDGQEKPEGEPWSGGTCWRHSNLVGMTQGLAKDLGWWSGPKDGEE